MAGRNLLVINSCLPPLVTAVLRNGAAVSLRYAESETAFSVQGMGLIAQALGEAGLAVAQIDAAVFVAGPGSFTGIRIGLSMLKGLAFGRPLPVTLLSSLELLAAPCYNRGRPVCPLINAHLGEVYAALYSPEGAELVAPRALPPAELAASLPRNVLFSGADTEKFREYFRGLDAEYCVPSPEAFADSLLRLGGERVEAGRTVLVSDAQPLYLRQSYAEIKRPV